MRTLHLIFLREEQIAQLTALLQQQEAEKMEAKRRAELAELKIKEIAAANAAAEKMKNELEQLVLQKVSQRLGNNTSNKSFFLRKQIFSLRREESLSQKV